MTSFNGKRHVVLRTMEECLWLQRALQLKHYSRIVPPISGDNCDISFAYWIIIPDWLNARARARLLDVKYHDSIVTVSFLINYSLPCDFSFYHSCYFVLSEPPAIPQDDPSLFERIVQAQVYVVQQFFTRICAHKVADSTRTCSWCFMTTDIFWLS
jgi:hypothetical protein